jgi:four helix bundle protein
MRHVDLEIYKKALAASRKISDLSKRFPGEESSFITDQLRRSSRSVCANLAEAWRKRRFQTEFCAKLNDAKDKAAETQTWLKFSVSCGYLKKETGSYLLEAYDEILIIVLNMISNCDYWSLPQEKK